MMLTFHQREHWHRARRSLSELPERRRHWADPAVETAVLCGHMAERHWVKPQRASWLRRLIVRVMR